MARRKRNKSPARDRYEKSHPVISFRVDRELYDRLKVVKKVEGRSMADILKAGLGLIEVKIRAEEEMWQRGYNEGYEKGIEAAEKLYMVTYPCSNCGQMKAVTTDEEKKAIRDFMVQSGWCHADCNDPWDSV